MRRREFVALVGGAAAWPGAARAQQPKRIGVFMNSAERDPQFQSQLAAFRQRGRDLGWIEGRNVHIDYRFALDAGGADKFPAFAKELVALQPDVVLAHGTGITAALQRESRAIPIVFVSVSDPIGSGFVDSLARPGGNLTGFLAFEEGIVGKWLGILKEAAPGITRVALMVNPREAPYDYFLRAAQTAASSLAVELVPAPVENAADIERTIESFARVPNGGLVLLPDTTTISRRDLIITLAARHRLPSVSAFRTYVVDGGLMSYGINRVDVFRQAATYIDRILRGERPADLPVQARVKYETVLNLKTAKALGLTVPDIVLVRADEVIE